MYAWQTLTLARVQFQGHSTRCLATAKDVLYLIGIPHFPDPAVIAIGEGAAVRLRWDVDGRVLQVDVDQLGVVSFNQFQADDSSSSSGGVDLQSAPGRHEVSGMVGWLLFGDTPIEPTPVEPKGLRLNGKPACVEDLEKAIREEANRRKKLSLKEASDDAVRHLLMTNIY